MHINIVREYLIFLQTLAQDILSDPTIAKSFISNPSEYIKSKGFAYENISVDSKLTKIILALADDEICEAIENGNITLYLNLLKNKGLLDNVSITELNQLKDYTSSLDKALTATNANKERVAASLFAFAAAVLVGVAAVVWAVVIEHFGAANAVAAATALVWKVGGITSGTAMRSHSETLMSTKAMRIWNLKSQDPYSTYLVADQFTADTVDSLIEYFRENMPELYSKTDLSNLRNAIIANLQNLPYED